MITGPSRFVNRDCSRQAPRNIIVAGRLSCHVNRLAVLGGPEHNGSRNLRLRDPLFVPREANPYGVDRMIS